MRTLHWIAGFGLSMTITACTAYVPRASPRIAEVTEGYARDGILIPHGFVDSGLGSAVAGNAAAEEYAAKYHRLTIAGFALDATTTALLIGGTAVPLSSSDAGVQAVGWGLLGGAGLTLLIGLSLHLAAAPHKLDAINTYNDGLSATPLLVVPPRLIEPPPAPAPLKPLRVPAATPPPKPLRVPSAVACTKDTDCKGDRVCEDGACVSPH